MRKIVLTFVTMFIPLMANAKVLIDGVFYDFDTSQKTAKVTYEKFVHDNIGADSYVNNTSSGDIIIPSEVKYNNVTYRVTSIGSYAFRRCSDLNSVTIPNSVTEIGEGAFSYCSNLKSVTIPNNVKDIWNWAFAFCSSLTSIDIPDGVTKIRQETFIGCSSLTSIDIPDGVTSIGISAFSSCTNLQTASILNSSKLTSIGHSSFSKCSSLTSINIPDGVTSIDYNTFSSCTNLQTASISNSSKLTSLGRSAFSGCSSLTSIIIPDGVTSIGEGAFSGCTNLQTASISNSSKLTSLGNSAFYNCSSLTSINIPDGVTSIGSYTFSGCCSLTSINIPDGVTSIGVETFKGCTNLQTASISNNSKLTSIGSYTFYNCRSLTSINIPDGVTSIGERAFQSCYDLQIVNISKSSKLTSVFSRAFYNCNSLKSFLIPANVETVGYGAFYGCGNISKLSLYCKNVGGWFSSNKKLEEILIGNSVETIKESAFKSFSSLTNLKFEDGSSLKEIEMYAFRDCDVLKEVDLPEPLETLGNYAFYSCDKLETIKLPKTLKTIHDNAFNNCSALKDIYAYMPNPFEINVAVFSTQTYKDATLHVNGVADKYRETYAWSKFFHIINLDETTTGLGDGGSDSGNPWNYNTMRYYYDITAQGSGEIVIDRRQDVLDIGGGGSYTYPVFEGKTIRNEHVNIEIPHLPNSGVDFKFYPDNGYVVKKVLYTQDKDAEELDVTENLVKKSNYYVYHAEDKGSNPKLVARFGKEGETEDDEDIITFACQDVKAICIANWDTNGDNELSKTEAAAVTSLGDGFKWLYNCSFDELQYFTGLTKLENGTFNGIILSLTIPASVTEIEEGALSGVKEVKLAEGNPKFILSDKILYNKENTEIIFCSRYKEGTVTIPSTVNKICSYAFNGCDKLEGVTLPEGLIFIDRDAFYGCSNIKELTLPSTLTEIGVNAFYDCHGLTAVYSMIMEPFSISHTVFERTIEFDDHSSTHYMPSSATLYVPSGKKEQYKSVPGFVNADDNGWTRFADIVEMGGDNPELNDGDVFTATNADGVEMTFQVISATDKTCEVARQGKDRNTIVTSPVPESITIPAEANGFKVVSIGYQAFYGAKGIKSVIIPEGVTSINTQAFRECYNLASITFPTSLEECGTDSFEDCAFGATVHISDLESWCNVSLPSWDLYGWHLFLNGEEVNDLVIPNGVTSIGESMALVSPLTNCASLTSVTIPASVTKMYAPFSGCSSLTTVTTFAEEPVAIFTGFPNATNSITNATLYVPKGSKAAYEAADYWKDFKEILEIEDETPEDIITFADSNVKAICVANWDTSGDGKLSKTEAAVVTSLGDVFMGNSEITSFDELQYFTGLTTIPDNAFYGCGSLKSIRLPKSLTSIGEYAFEDCTSLETVVSFIETPFELGEGAFCARESYDGGNDWLEFDLHFNLYVPIGTKGLYRAAGWDVDESYGNYRTILSGTPENPGSFTFDGIVYDPIDATTVELIDGKNASGDVAIPSMVTNGNVSYQVTEIGACAFKGNTSLTSIVIPNCIKAIRPFAFNGCTGLTTVISYIETPFSLGALKGVFLNNENVVYATYLQFTLYVPAGTKSLYEQASWTDASRIVEMGGDAYAVFDSTTGTLTFKCGEKPSSDNVYDAEDTKGNPGWRTQMTKVKKVVFDDSFALARPTSTASWFAFGSNDDSSQFTEVIGIQNLNTSNVTNMREMFSRCLSLTSLDLSHFDTSNVTNMNNMFFSCIGLTNLDVSHFNTNNVTDMFNMFCGCSSLTNLDVSSFDTHNVQNMGGMFSGCEALTHINIDNFETGNVTSMKQMFSWCKSLTSLDLRKFNTSNVTDMYMMFYACSNLTGICVSDKWSTAKVTSGNDMFKFCDRLVGGKGSKPDYDHSDYAYAHIDGGTDNPGYFTSAGKLGDANGDGYVNMTDVNVVKDYIMKGKTEGFNFINADANGDKVVNAADIVRIINIIKNKKSSEIPESEAEAPDVSNEPDNDV
jgi:surface protein